MANQYLEKVAFGGWLGTAAKGIGSIVRGANSTVRNLVRPGMPGTVGSMARNPLSAAPRPGFTRNVVPDITKGNISLKPHVDASGTIKGFRPTTDRVPPSQQPRSPNLKTQPINQPGADTAGETPGVFSRMGDWANRNKGKLALGIGAGAVAGVGGHMLMNQNQNNTQGYPG